MSPFKRFPCAEIDLVLELPGARRWAIEIKRSSAPKLERGFYHACEDLEPQRRYVVYSGAERYPIAGGIEALSLGDMVKTLAQNEARGRRRAGSRDPL